MWDKLKSGKIKHTLGKLGSSASHIAGKVLQGIDKSSGIINAGQKIGNKIADGLSVALPQYSGAIMSAKNAVNKGVDKVQSMIHKGQGHITNAKQMLESKKGNGLEKQDTADIPEDTAEES